MGTPYIFNYAAWIASFPEFTAVQQATAQGYFEQAVLFWRNDGTSPNRDPTGTGSQQTILNCVTAHIAAIFSQAQGSSTPGAAQDPNNPVGRVTNATVGSVTVQTDLGVNPTNSDLKAYFRQTKYGVQFLAMTMAYKLFRYATGRGPSWGPGFGPAGQVL